MSLSAVFTPGKTFSCPPIDLLGAKRADRVDITQRRTNDIDSKQDAVIGMNAKDKSVGVNCCAEHDILS